MTKLLQERIYPEISDSVYELILDLTSNNNKANSKTKWVCKQYIDGKMGEFDDGIVSFYLQDLLASYDRYKSKLKPIIDYKDKFELEDDIVRIKNDGYKTNSELNKLASKGAKKIYNDNNFSIYHISTPEACRKYGSNTTWCITARMDDYSFNRYKEEYDGEIYFIIDKKNKNNKYACVGNIMYTEFDESILVIPDSIDEFTTTQVSSDELYWRIRDNPSLKDVIPYGFPTFDKKLVEETIELTIEELG